MKIKLAFRFILLVGATVSFLSLRAQNFIITGEIKDSVSSTPVYGCSIVLQGSSVATSTDETGIFKLTFIGGASQVKLIISHLGYKSDTIPVESSKKYYSIRLVPLTNSLNSVTVTGSSPTEEIKRDPSTVKLVPAKAIDQTSADNIVDALVENVPGMEAVKTGPNVSKPFIRGLGYNRIETTYDGVPHEGQQFEDEEVLEVDMYSVENAEIIMGPTTLMYGPDALAGLVNLIPFIPKDTDKTVHGRVLSEYQNNNGMIGNGLSLNYGNANWSFIWRGAYRIARDYENSVDGRVYNTEFREANTSATVVHTSNTGYSDLSVSLYDDLQGIPDGSRDSATRQFTKQIYDDPFDNIDTRPVVSNAELNSYNINPVYQHIQQYMAYSNNHYEFTDFSLDGMASFQQNIRKEYDYPADPTQPGVSMLLNSYNYNLRYTSKDEGDEPTQLGINGMYQTNTNVNATDIPIPNYHLFDMGIFILKKITTERWSFCFGARGDVRIVTGNNFYVKMDSATEFVRQVNPPDTAGSRLLFPSFEKIFTGASLAFGATYKITNKISIKANISRGSGAPDVTEFASNGLDASAHTYFIGKDNIDPENNIEEDIGTVISSEFMDASASIFNNNLQQYTYLVQLANPNGTPLEIIPGNRTMEYEQSAAWLYGAESMFTIHPEMFKGFEYTNQFSLIYGYNMASQYRKAGVNGEYLPLIPPLCLLNRISKDIKTKSKIITMLKVKAEVIYNGTQNRYLALNGTETATPSYTLVNAGIISYIEYDKTSVLQFQLLVNNIFNVAYQSNLSRLKYLEYYSYSPTGHYGIYDMGRNICVKLIMPF